MDAPVNASWWREADALAAAPDPAAIDRLQATAASAPAGIDETERQDEMIDGLRRLSTLTQRPELPVIATQHRVIGDEACHLVAPASVGDDTGAGKVFVTTTRLLLVGGPKVVTRPWHRIHSAVRAGRDVVLAGRGAADPIQVRCNTYGDALMLEYMARRLMPTS